MGTKEFIIALAVCIAVSSFVSFKIGRKSVLDNIKEKTDTVYSETILYDTVWYPKPEPYIVYLKGDSIPYPVPGPERVDTVYLPREVKVYKDSSYYAVVSGVEPSLDTISVYGKTILIETLVNKEKIVPKNTHWGIGVQAGYGAFVVDEKIKGSPYIGLGLSYNILSW